MDTILQDLRFAARGLTKNKGFTAIAVACLAIGIGANTTVFSAVNTLLLRPLPFEDPDRVMTMYTARDERTARDDYENFSYPEFLDFAGGDGAFAATAAFHSERVNLGGIEEPERLRAARTSASLFPLLGLRAVIGRTFRQDEDETGKVVVLSHGLWQRRFAADTSAVGRVVTVDGEPYTVIGVLQSGIQFPETAQLWLTLEPGAARTERDWRTFDVIARLEPGVTVEQARTRVAAIANRLSERYPESNAARVATVEPYRELFAREVRPMMMISLGAVGFVLLIACANVANLLLAKATARRREIAVRVAMGATGARIVRLLLTESLLIGLLGGALGALIGAWGIDAIAASLPSDDLPFWMVFDFDRRVLLSTFAVSLLTGVVFGLAPALRAARPDLTVALKEGGERGSTTGGRGGRMRSALVVSQLALSLVLLAGATLMIRSFLRLQTASPGFEVSGVLTLETSLQGTRYDGPPAVAGAYRGMLERIAAIPGVEHAGAVSQLPVGTCCSSMTYFPEGRTYLPSEAPASLTSAVTPSYFSALGIPLVAGRAFDERDRSVAPKVAIVNQTMARREWPGENALGKRLRLGPDDTAWVTVVGVVGDVKQRELTDPDRRQMYLPHAQRSWRSMALVVRARGNPVDLAQPVRDAVRAEDKDLPVAELRTMREVVSRRMFQPRIYGAMFGVFAFAALLLATVGLYGVMAYTVSQRTHEMGIRVALGAQASDILRLILGRGARLTALGLLIGIPAALALARVLRGALYGVSASDPATFVAIPLLLSAVALFASYVPARRAARVDPIAALRSE